MKIGFNRSNLKRVLYWFVILLVLAVLVLWFTRNMIANTLLENAIAKITAKSNKAGVELVELRTGEMQIPSPFRATMQNVETQFDVGKKNQKQLRSEFEATEVEVTAAGVFPPKVRVKINDFSVKFHEEDLPRDFPFDVFYQGTFESAPMPLLNPEQGLLDALSRLRTLFAENSVDADCNFSGYVSVVADREKMDALIYTEELPSGEKRLRFKKQDLESIIKKADVRIGDDMVNILSEYPLRAPLILAISKKAKESAKAKKARDASYPDDAFRHIQSSYHLTKAFGAEFAKRITDSHETLAGNTVNERLMDYHNNAVARQLVEEKVKEQELEKIILTDPRVIRDPNEVPNFKKLLK